MIIKNEMTDAVMFGPDGKNILPAAILYKKNILALRGSFRPVKYNNQSSEESILLLKSKSITEIYKVLNEQNNKNKIIPYDIRHWFLGLDQQQSLYHSDYIKNKVKDKNYKIIKEQYIDCFFTKCNKNKELFNTQTYTEEIKHLLNNIKQSIFKEFKNISINIDKKTPKNIQELLRKNWQKVTDFFILTILFKQDNNNEYIIITGMHHFDFLTEELQKISYVVNLQNFEENRGSDNCVSVYEPIVL